MLNEEGGKIWNGALPSRYGCRSPMVMGGFGLRRDRETNIIEMERPALLAPE
jgi:hypothetical protein